MIKRVTPEKTPFEKYFVFEAPKKSNVRVLKTKPDGRYRDYTAGADPFDTEDEPADDIPTEDDMDLVDADDDTDFTDDADDFGDLEDDDPGADEPDIGGDDDFTDGADLGEEDPPADATGDIPDTGDAPDTGEGDDFTDGADGVEDASDTGDDGGDVPDTGDDAPDTGEDTDFTDGADGGDTGDESNDDSSDDTGDTSSKSIPDQLKAYNLYNKYLELYEAIKRYISKLDSLVKDSMDANLIIRTASSNLRELEDLIYDYMLYQYQSASYTKSLIFYEKMLLSVRLVFKLLENINVNDETKPKH